MFAKEALSYRAVPLPDRNEMTDAEMIAAAEAFYDTMRRRHTVRDYDSRPVPRAVIESCLRTAGSAPSGANHQPWHFVAIESREIKKQIRKQAEAHERGFYSGRAGEEWLDALKPLGTDADKPYLETAPWLIAIFSQKKGGITVEENNTNYYVHESVGIATGFLINALHTSGLATLTHTPKPMSFLNKICQRGDNDRAYMLLIAGYPAEDATIPEHAKVKKPLEDIATFL